MPLPNLFPKREEPCRIMQKVWHFVNGEIPKTAADVSLLISFFIKRFGLPEAAIKESTYRIDCNNQRDRLRTSGFAILSIAPSSILPSRYHPTIAVVDKLAFDGTMRTISPLPSRQRHSAYRSDRSRRKCYRSRYDVRCQIFCLIFP